MKRCECKVHPSDSQLRRAPLEVVATQRIVGIALLHALDVAVFGGVHLDFVAVIHEWRNVHH
jgi:hypothetical protein